MPKGRVASAVGVTIVALAATGSLGRAGICPCGPPYAGVLVGLAPAVPSVRAPVVTVDRQGRVVAVFAQRAGAGVLVVRDVSTGKLLRRVWTTRSASPPMWSPDGKTVTIGG